jgi:hypothetical protein
MPIYIYNVPGRKYFLSMVGLTDMKKHLFLFFFFKLNSGTFFERKNQFFFNFSSFLTQTHTHTQIQFYHGFFVFFWIF